MKRHISLCLLAAMLTGILASCGDESTPSDTTASGGSTETTAASTEETLFVPDDLPDDLDFGEKTVSIYIGDYAGAFLDDMYSEEATGSRLNDAVYNSIMSVQSRLNVTLDYGWDTYPTSDVNQFQTKVISLIMAGDAMDILFDVTNYTSQMLEGEYFVNLAETKYIDLDKPWYNQTIMTNMSDDYIHFVSGMFSLANVKSVFSMFYNDDLYQSLGKTENLYDIVDSGGWTLAKLEELIRDTYADLNGSTSSDPSDQFGLTFGDANKYLGFMPAFGVEMFRKTKDGYDFLFDNERAVDVVQSLCTLINENESVLPGNMNTDKFPDYQISSGGGNYASKLFMEGRALFTCSLIADAATIVPDISFSYGLLPYPKWDEAQENYQTILQRNCYALIPTTTADEDAASAVLEALASEAYRTIVPEYCEVTLKVRYAQDEDVSRMFDLIINSAVYDPGEIYGSLLGTPKSDFRTALINNNSNWASTIASKKNSLIEKMNQIIN